MRQHTPGADTDGAGDTVRTGCGRRITVGRFRLDGLPYPAERVTIDIDRQQYDREEMWASLTPAEARGLAGSLLAHAAAAERGAVEETGVVAEAAEAGAAKAVECGPAVGEARTGREVSPAGRIEVTPAGGEAYALAVRSHALFVDQPHDSGGEDAAATPTELFVGSLASCVAFYAGRYLSRHGVGRDGLSVVADFSMAVDRPARVAGIRIGVRVPSDLPERRRAALLAVASHCTVHNTLTNPPKVEIDLV